MVFFLIYSLFNLACLGMPFLIVNNGINDKVRVENEMEKYTFLTTTVPFFFPKIAGFDTLLCRPFF